jgi:hypothetical protein
MVKVLSAARARCSTLRICPRSIEAPSYPAASSAWMTASVWMRLRSYTSGNTRSSPPCTTMGSYRMVSGTGARKVDQRVVPDRRRIASISAGATVGCARV